MAASNSTGAETAIEDRVVRRAFRRIIVFLFLLHVAAFIDRGNLGFAALTMNRQLGLNATMYGMTTTVFYAGYILCEVPSNLLLARFGARLWLARIMLTLGLAASATMLAIGPSSLYGIRAVVGAAEAGFFPGVLLYLTYWFPRSYRARAIALFMMAQPLTSALVATVSGFILEMDGFLGLSGWRWLFLLEGLPAVALGAITYFWLDDGPQQARWLTPEEKAALGRRLEADRALEAGGTARRSVLSLLANPTVLLLAAADFGLIVSLANNGVWTPFIVRAFAAKSSFSIVGLLAAVPAVLTFLAMPLWGASSDRRQERMWHYCGAILVAAAGWLVIGWSGNPAVQYYGMIVVAIASYAALPIYWTFPSSAATLAPEARPAGIALINSLGLTGAMLGPLVVGILKDRTGAYGAGFAFVALMMLVGIACIGLVTMRRGAAAVSAPVA